MRFALVLLFLSSVLAAQPVCQTKPTFTPMRSFLSADPLDGEYCVTEYIEVNYDIVEYFGGIDEAEVFIEYALEQKAKAFLYHDINMSFIVNYWDEPSPYTEENVGRKLTQFTQYLADNGGHPGDMAHLLTFEGSGGVAYLDVICNNRFGAAVSSINPQVAPYPQESWTTTVQAHETGHMLGCAHTHACIYTIDGEPNRAIDGCSPFGMEGNCDNPGLPDEGTIMSYCHLQGSVGISYSTGFHPIHVGIMKNTIANAPCADCEEEPDEPVECEDNQVIVEVLTDFWPDQTSWQITRDGLIVAFSQPWTLEQMNSIQSDTLCLPNGCYEFTIIDKNGLGPIACSEGMYVVNGPEGELASGQEFELSETTTFCLGSARPCEDIGLATQTYLTYSNQNRSDSYSIIEGELTLSQNTWKAIEFDYQEGTYLEFDYFQESPGEIMGIGFTPTISALYPQTTYNLTGFQQWGNYSYRVEAGQWETVRIPIPESNYIVFVNDDDRPRPTASGKYRNVKICRGEVAAPSTAFLSLNEEDPEPFPNPSEDIIYIPNGPWILLNIFGYEEERGNGYIVDLSGYRPGGYYILYGTTYRLVIKR